MSVLKEHKTVLTCCGWCVVHTVISPSPLMKDDVCSHEVDLGLIARCYSRCCCYCSDDVNTVGDFLLHN